MARPELRVVGRAEDLAGLADDDLMLLSRQGRRDAFEVLVARHTRLVLGTAIRFLGDRATGREVAQDVFLMLWSERERYVPKQKLKSLLITMTFNRCRALSRQRKNDRKKSETLAMLDHDVSDPATPLEQLLEQNRAAIVRAELTRLPEPVREILILRFAQDLSVQEIAEVTDKPVGTIKSHLFRGLKKLAQIFSKEGTP
jgi:RNA polymerase sigma-70 factor, ECF subfamily